MKRLYKVLGVALIGVVAMSGVAAATGGIAAAPQATDTTNGFGPDNGAQIHATNADRPLDGSNGPWMTGDERLDRFQERFNLTDEQVDTIQDEVRAMIDDDVAPEEIRATVTQLLESFGVEDPTLGPPADGRLHEGPYGPMVGQGSGAGNGHGPNGPADGPGAGSGHGPFGSADGPGAGNGPSSPGYGPCHG